MKRKEISEVVGAIKYLTGVIAGGETKENKIAFMKKHLKVNQFDQLYKLPLDEVKEIHQSLVLLKSKKEIERGEVESKTDAQELKPDTPSPKTGTPRFRLGESHD